MSDKEIKKKTAVPWGLIAVMVILIGVAVYIVKMVLSDDSPRKKSSFTTVTLLKPPPLPPIKEKLPEPEQIKEIKKQEEVFSSIPQAMDSSPGEQDNTPAGENLGVDAEGGAGGDAFGLVGKKGGKSILSGGGGTGSGPGRTSLLNTYAGYVQHVNDEMKKRIWKILDEEGRWQRGKLQVSVRVSVDGKGAVVDYRIIGSSGNHKMDEAVKQALNNYKISQPPPDGLPKTMTIKISSQV